MSPRSILLLALAAALLNAVAPAQDLQAQTTRTIQGVVKDSQTGEALPGAVVAIPGTALGGITNADGRFAIVGVPTTTAGT